MGPWGGKPYDSDFACDVRADIAGYMRVASALTWPNDLERGDAPAN
jgi:hypothetical protein